MTNNLSEYILTTDGIARKLGYHVQYVRLLASAGKLPAIKRGRQWLFNEAEVFAFLKKNTEKIVNRGAHAQGTDPGRDLLR